jgi:hypothetical protein
MESGNIRKRFNEEEAKQIIEGTLDVTKFFKYKEESNNRLMAALKGRPVYPGQKERDDILQRGSKLKEEIKEFRLKYKIENPPEHAERKLEEVS